MIFNWGNFLSLAQKLKADGTENPPDEARLRSAASRAYYAAYHLAQKYAEKNLGYSRQRIDSHKELIDHYQKQNNIVIKKIGADLGHLKKWRIEADYDDEIRDTTPVCLADKSIKMADVIINTLRNLNK